METKNSKFEIFAFDENQKKEWDSFVEKNSRGSIHQISEWAEFQKTIPGRTEVLGFGVRDKVSKEILATVFCVKMETGFLKKFWWYSARGPVFDPIKNTEAGKFLGTQVEQKLKKTGGLFWRFDPYFTKTEYDLLELKNKKEATQNYQPTDTLVIDLTKSNDQLLTEMKRKGRYNIKLAQEKGVTIVAIPNGTATEKDLDDFWKLNHETTSRDGFHGHEKSYYKNFLVHLKKQAVLFFAEYEGKRIATAISTFCHDKAIYYFGASTSEEKYRNLMAPYLLQWEMMQFARSHNCKTYDFLGIAPEGIENHAYSGISEFKWKFGGARQTFSAGKEIIFSPMWYTFYRLAKRK